jgi:hypothetical protein
VQLGQGRRWARPPLRLGTGRRPLRCRTLVRLGGPRGHSKRTGGPADSAIYRWEGSGPWQAVAGPLDSHVYALTSGNGQLFAGLGDGTLLQSEEGGENWTEQGERIGGITALVVR